MSREFVAWMWTCRAVFEVMHMQASEWKKTLLPSPQQGDGHGGPGVDCGVFAMLAMKMMYTSRPLDYTQEQVTSFYRAVCTMECASLQLWGMSAPCV